MDNIRSSNTGWNITLGIILMILGLIVLGAQIFTSFLSVFFLGFMLVLGGVTQFFYGFFSGSWSNFFLSILGGVISFIFGLIIMANPGISVATFSLLIGILLLISGIYKIFTSLFVHEGQWGWSLLGGIVILLLGISIFSGWPFTGLWIIGLFIGVELFATGFVLTVTASQTREELATGRSSYMSGAKGGGAKKDKRFENDDEELE